MKARESIWYLGPELLLGLSFILILAVLEWHFILVLKLGYLTVFEKYGWILKPEAYGLVPFTVLFGIFKLGEDLILSLRGGRSAWYFFTEIGLGLLFVASTGFIEYHLLEVISHGESRIMFQNHWIVPSLVWIIIPVWIIIGIYKFQQDVKALLAAKKKER